LAILVLNVVQARGWGKPHNAVQLEMLKMRIPLVLAEAGTQKVSGFPLSREWAGEKPLMIIF
jgi:hypothetical protein